MNRPDISRLNKNRSIFLQVGFVAALSLTLMAFNYTVHDSEDPDFKPPVAMEKDVLDEVQRTIHKEKTMPPPPVLKPTENFIPDEEIVFDPEPEPEPIDPEIKVDPTPKEPMPRPAVAAAPKPPVVVPPEPVDEGPDLPFIIVEKMPRFPGCEEQDISESERKACADKKMLQYIYANVKYPPIATENGIEGTAVVSFIIEKDGSISALKVAREIGGGCGDEVVRVVKNMPHWIAGEQRGRKVRVQFNLPVRFQLN